MNGWNNLCSFVKELSVPPAAIDNTLLKTTLGFKLLIGAGFMSDEKMHVKKINKLLTNLVYKQQKYNLLREETEGYSKLMVVLCSMPSYPEDVSQYVQQVISLIGRFELDPNRALDVILDAFEQQIWNLSFITLLKNFCKGNIPHILGFKYTFYHTPSIVPSAVDTKEIIPISSAAESSTKSGPGKDNNAAAKGSALQNSAVIPKQNIPKIPNVPTEVPKPSRGSNTPQSLYELTAVLMAAGLIKIEDLLPYMQPSLEMTIAAAVEVENACSAEIRTHGAMNLTQIDENNSVTNRAVPPGLQMPMPVTVVPIQTRTGPGYLGGPVAPVNNPFNSAAGFRLPIAPGLGAPFPPPPTPFGSNRRNAPPSVAQPPIQNMAIAQALPSNTVKGKQNENEKESDKMKDKEKIKLDGVESDENMKVFADGNQIIGLISALLSVRCWNLAHSLILLLQTEIVSTDIMQYPAVRDAVCEFLLWSTDRVYAPLSFSILKLSRGKTRPPILGGTNRLMLAPESERFLLKREQSTPYQSLSTLPHDMAPILSVTRHHLCKNVELYIRVCRLYEAHIVAITGQDLKNVQTNTNNNSTNNASVKFDMDSEERNTKNDESALQSVADMIEISLLPGLTVSERNPAISRQLWRVISKLPFQLRYTLYDKWRGGGLAKDGLGLKSNQVVMAETEALFGCKYHLKRLAKDNVSAVGVRLAYFSELAPIVVFNHVLNQIESYDNLIPYIVDALKSCSALSNDVMTYCIINQLDKDSDKLKKGDTHYSSWFSALAKFTAFFFKKYPQSEVKGNLVFYL